MLVNKQDILFEARVEVGLQPELADDGVVVTVYVGVDAVHALEDLADEGWEGFRERDTYWTGEQLGLIRSTAPT